MTLLLFFTQSHISYLTILCPDRKIMNEGDFAYWRARLT